MEKKKLSRRDFLKVAAGSAAGAALATGSAVAYARPPLQERTPILMWYQAQNHQPEYDRRKEEFQDQFNIDLTYEVLSRDAMNQKLPTTLMAGSDFPDIIEQNAGDIVGFLKGPDRAIPFVALNEALEQSPYAGDVLQARFDRYTKDGLIYGTPHDVHPIVMLYNEQAWGEFGVDMEAVETWDDFLAAAQMVGTDATMSDGRPRYAIMDCNACANLLTLLLQNGVWFTDENGDPQIGDPAFRTAVETWSQFQPYVVDIDWASQVAMFKEGQFLTQLAPDWLFGIHKQGTLDDEEFLANSPIRMKYVPDAPATGTWGGTAASVIKASHNIDLSLQVLLYIYFENGDGQLAQRFIDIGILPPVVSSWDDPIFSEPEPYVGDQLAGQYFIEAAKGLPSYHESWTTPITQDAFGTQFSLVWAGELDLDTALDTALAEAQRQIEQNA